MRRWNGWCDDSLESWLPAEACRFMHDVIGAGMRRAGGVNAPAMRR